MNIDNVEKIDNLCAELEQLFVQAETKDAIYPIIKLASFIMKSKDVESLAHSCAKEYIKASNPKETGVGYDDIKNGNFSIDSYEFTDDDSKYVIYIPGEFGQSCRVPLEILWDKKAVLKTASEKYAIAKEKEEKKNAEMQAEREVAERALFAKLQAKFEKAKFTQRMNE